ncbi:hypothetical protein ADILRU_0266 [Leifsonia rubra CMS 76R]|nr:hypothetical protein ADILRU_0266 [Leifsonia rubra CMS 76R]
MPSALWSLLHSAVASGLRDSDHFRVAGVVSTVKLWVMAAVNTLWPSP